MATHIIKVVLTMPFETRFSSKRTGPKIFVHNNFILKGFNGDMMCND